MWRRYRLLYLFPFELSQMVGMTANEGADMNRGHIRQRARTNPNS